MTGDFTGAMERPEQFTVDVCNAVHWRLDLTYLSVPSHFIAGEGKRVKEDREEIGAPRRDSSYWR